MTSTIEEFRSKSIPEGYYHKLLEDSKKLDAKLHGFNLFNSGLREGFPFSVKDNICVKSFEATASSKILKGYVPPFNATAVERMLGSGFGFLGKTNMDEFGFGSFGINTGISARNPFNDRYVAGGSSSGAAIATATIKYHVAIAESTGGSISAPASFCGVVGFTPTYGAVSRYGLIDYANSLDKIGVMGRSSDDIKEVFDKIKGTDEYDTTCSNHDFNNAGGGKDIVVIDEQIENLDENIKSSFERLLGKLANQGYEIKHASLNLLPKAVATYYIISMAESSTNLAKYTGFKYGYKIENFGLKYNDFFSEAREQFGTEAKRRILLGTFVRSASIKSKYYSKALKVRSILLNKLKEIMKKGRILTPTMPILPPKIDDADKMTPLQVYALDTLTIPPNLCGFPHVSFPYDYIGNLPIGAQIVGDHFDDYALLEFVNRWEGTFKYKFAYDLGAL